MTPLLDWTRSPYIAAFFAYSDAFNSANPDWSREVNSGGQLPDGHINVWELTTTDELRALTEVRFIQPSGVAFHRQRAQEGLFTWLDDAVHVDIASYLEHHGLGHLLRKYQLPLGGEGKLAIIDLHRMAINYGTLFPDLNGAAQQANLQPMYDTLNVVN